MNTVQLTDDQYRLIQAILLQTNETRSCLAIAEQLGVAYKNDTPLDEPPVWDTENVERIEATFDTLLPLFHIGA